MVAQTEAEPAVAAATASTSSSTGASGAEDSSLGGLIGRARVLTEANVESYIRRLEKAVAIESVSTDLSKRSACVDMAAVIQGWVEQLGGTCERVLVGFQQLDDGTRYDLPPVLLAHFKAVDERTKKPFPPAARPTVLVYLFYDVASAPGVSSELREEKVEGGEEILRGLGVAGDKVNLLSWLWAVELFKTLEMPLPFHLKFVIEGMHCSHSECLTDLLDRETTARNGFLNNVDYVLYSSSQVPWFRPGRPAVVYATRGNLALDVSVQSAATTVHNQFAGIVAEPMNELVHCLAAVTANAELAARIGAGVFITQEEKALFKSLRPTHRELREKVGNVPKLLGVRLQEPAATVQEQPEETGADTAADKETVSTEQAATKEKLPSDTSNDAEQTAAQPAGDTQNDEENVGKTTTTAAEDTGNATTTDAPSQQQPAEQKGTERTSDSDGVDNDSDDATEVLIKNWKLPSISIHSIETNSSPLTTTSTASRQGNDNGAAAGSVTSLNANASQLTMPGLVNARMSVKLGDGADGTAIETAVRAVLQREFEGLGSPNEMSISATCYPGWHMRDLDVVRAHSNTLVAACGAALLRTFGARPDIIRYGGNIPAVSVLAQRVPCKNMIVLPLGGAGDRDPHATSKKDYLAAVNTLFVVLLEVEKAIAKENADKQSAGVRKGALGRLKDIWYGLS